MPAYMSHEVMSIDVYNRLMNDDKLVRVGLDKDGLKTFSIGTDLALLTKSRYDTHNKDTKYFLLEMIKYIKENNLRDNENVMSLLYGHLIHYFMDINCHPLIFYYEKGLESTKVLANHLLIEGYINSYLCEKVLNKDFMDCKLKVKSSLMRKKEICSLVDYIYRKIYKEDGALFSYKMIMKFVNMGEDLAKSGLFSKDTLIRMVEFDRFLSVNGINKRDLLNYREDLWLNPVTGDEHYDSFDELYNKSINDSLTAIGEVNKYLYDGVSLEKVDELIENISYDTGVDCDCGANMKFVYKRR